MKVLVLMVMVFGFMFGSVDINQANVKELSALKGVGLKKAAAIVEFRKLNCFKSVDDILKVKGLGKKFLDKNRENLSVSECPTSIK